ncbi:efflux RND transporter periplasmic adaptor subunit [candidate division KSB1 bacterium]|nr:efflux RND transporter periplasmic adaptor subunit [candidate division KSB1 bacterium]
MHTKFKTLLIVLLNLIIISGCGSKIARQIETYKVKRGEFLINVVETGELKATVSTMVSAPAIDWRFGDLKITKLIEDGMQVQIGDTLVLFDPAEVQKAIIDKKAELDIARAEYTKMEADQKSKIEELEADLKMAEISYQISQLELEQAAYQADIKKKEIQLQLQQSEISLKKAREEIENQKMIHLEELRKQQLKISQLESNLAAANETLTKLTVKAPGPGLVIIEENWMSDAKWQVGEQPWSGVPIMSLPDLSQIKAMTEINEVDISKVKMGQKVKIKLDAYPDTTFTGEVIDIALLAKRKDRKSDVKVFPVEILISGNHKLLKPGMTVNCDIIADKIDSVLFIPLEGLFIKNEKRIVYLKKGNDYKPQEVRVGRENNDYVVIEEGLKEGNEIALNDPSQILTTEKGKNQGETK